MILKMVNSTSVKEIARFLEGIVKKIPSETYDKFLKDVYRQVKRIGRDYVEDTAGVAYLILNGPPTLKEAVDFVPIARERVGTPRELELTVEEGIGSLPKEDFVKAQVETCEMHPDLGRTYSITARWYGHSNLKTAKALRDLWCGGLEPEMDCEDEPTPFKKRHNEACVADVVWKEKGEWHETDDLL